MDQPRQPIIIDPARRQAAIERYRILGTGTEHGLDELARLAADLCGVPAALVGLHGRGQLILKAAHGLSPQAVPLDDPGILDEAVTVSEAADFPLMAALPGARFCAAAALRTREGAAIGTLAVLAPAAPEWTEGRARGLAVLARQVVAQLDLASIAAEGTERDDRYRTLFEAMDEGFCIIEFLDGPEGPLSDYVHVEANPAYTRNAGIPDVVGQRVRQMVPDEAGDWVERYGAVLRTGKPIRFERELEKTGRYLSLSAFRIEPLSRRQVAVLFQDITARRRAEVELVQVNATLEARIAEAVAQRQVLADVVEGTDAFVLVIDRDGRLLAINGAATAEIARLCGVAPQVGDRLPELFAARPEITAIVTPMWQRALSGEAFVETLAIGDRHYEVRYNVLRDAMGVQVGAYQFVYDVTDRLEEQSRLAAAEEALRQAQKMEAVGQLTGGLAHDFNNLLAGVSGAFEMIGTRLSQGRGRDVEKYLAAGQGATRRAAALTHRLLAFSRRQTLSPRPLIVNRLMTDLVELVQRTVGPDIRVETIAAMGLWPTLVDANQLENAILNLCINARDAMPEGGQITLETANRWIDRRTAAARGLEPGQYVTICVSDTGTGIDAATLERVFDPFFTTKPQGEGTGLGLSMVYGFARQSNGHVRIYSEVGQGTMVCLYLPRHLGEADETDDLTVAAVPLARVDGKAVLVVDDEPTVRMLVVDALEEMGHACAEAGDGPEGLRILDAAERIDLLITDVGLPGGMNGRQVAEAARERIPGLRILFITGYAENAVLNHGHIAPGMEVLTKPFAIEDLRMRVDRLLRE
ncbi:hybrid sensor histidine kinase/response regulator [Sphingomonas metalli]|uniref:histidine kinase n=1 Tax=Sphingomonas metalli TaxID=1779358 RepID=A0A916WU03_9SPHN|nr:ATP-binding protein [Sphingomonas metalli]GGB29632.1 hybrid sensor histidine kinase/response regulator [Sphingomonas metalli]